MINGMLLICAATVLSHSSAEHSFKDHGYSRDPAGWRTRYGPALRTARQEQRPLIVVLDVVLNEPNQPWLSAPIRFSSTGAPSTSTRPESVSRPGSAAQDVLNKYELCHIDVTSDYGKRMAKAFKATEFPHTAVIDKQGRDIIYRKTGRFSTKEWRGLLNAYQHGVRPVSASKTSQGSTGKGATSQASSSRRVLNRRAANQPGPQVSSTAWGQPSMGTPSHYSAQPINGGQMSGQYQGQPSFGGQPTFGGSFGSQGFGSPAACFT